MVVTWARKSDDETELRLLSYSSWAEAVALTLLTPYQCEIQRIKNYIKCLKRHCKSSTLMLLLTLRMNVCRTNSYLGLTASVYSCPSVLCSCSYNHYLVFQPYRC